MDSIRSQFAEQYLAMTTAKSLDGLIEVQKRYQGQPAFNTLAVSSDGRAWFGDTSATPNLSPEAKAVLEAVADGFDTCEAVSVKLGLETAEVEAELARLEVAGYLACSLLGQYIRTGLGTTG